MKKTLMFFALVIAGVLFASGCGKKDYKDMKSLVAAAKDGETEAQYLLGMKLKNGDGVQADALQAAKWFRKAAAKGHAPSKYELAMHYDTLYDENGRRLELGRAMRKMAALLHEAAEAGYAPAQLELGLRHRTDQRGVEISRQASLKWIRAAAEQGYVPAQYELGKCYEMEWYGEDQAEAEKWFRKAAENGDSDAQVKMSSLYISGKGVPRDCNEAAKWARKAADQGNSDGQTLVGALYLDGFPEKNPAEAVKWLRKAAEKKHRGAYYLLGQCYENGNGVEKNLDEALKCYYASGTPQAHQRINKIELEKSSKK